MEKSLGRIAEDAFGSSMRRVSGPNLWEETAAAVEKAVLARLKKDAEEPMPVAGQELTFVQAAQWVAKYGSTDGLQWFCMDKQEWRKDGYSKGISSCFKYRVAPKKVNDPDDVKVLPMGEYKSLIENQMPSIENLEVGQELNPYQVLKWIEKYGSASGLQYMYLHEWADCEGTLNSVIDTQRRYRVAPKKVNAPDDPTTWERGVSIFYRDCEYDSWTLGIFISYSNCRIYKYCSKRGSHKYAKLATPEQVEAWKLIND